MISHALIDDLQITLPSYLDTLDGFRKWVGSGQFPQRGQVAYLDKEIFIDMSPERLESHNKPKSVINRVLGNLVEELDLGNLYQDRLWLTNDAARLSTEPDGTVRKLADGREQPHRNRCRRRRGRRRVRDAWLARLGVGGCQQNVSTQGH